jgi:hypothetical protein
MHGVHVLACIGLQPGPVQVGRVGRHWHAWRTCSRVHRPSTRTCQSGMFNLSAASVIYHVHYQWCTLLWCTNVLMKSIYVVCINCLTLWCNKKKLITVLTT